MFRLIKQVFIGLLASIVNAFNGAKCISLNNLQCMIQPTLINLGFNEYGQGLHYYSFAVNLGRCMGRCNTLNNVSNRLCVRKCFYYDDRNKRIKNLNKTYITQV